MAENIIPCPFVYANGKPCKGNVAYVEAYKSDLTWLPNEDGVWRMTAGQPRSHYHLFCSEKGNHAGSQQRDNPRMKFFFGELPKPLQDAISGK